MKASFSSKRLFLIAAVILAVLPYFVKLGSSSLWDSNEAFYAETPREIIEAGDFINPTFNHEPRFNKPPLVYWVVALFYRMFGVTEGVERFPIALAALVLIGTAFWLGRAAFSTDAGLMAAIALAATPRFLMFSRRIIIDVYLAMFMGLALLMFVLAELHPRRRKLCLSLMYASVGLGILTKGPVAALLPAAAILVYLAVHRRLTVLRELMLPAGFLIIAAIVAPWYAAIYAEHGWQYIKSFLLDDNISRFTFTYRPVGSEVWGPRRSIFFYIPVIAGDLLPWSVFLPLAIWLQLRFKLNRRKTPKITPDGSTLTPADPPNEPSQQGSEGEKPSGILLLIWIAVIVLFFSISRNKEDLYVLPVYPAAAALIGGLLARAGNKDGTRWLSMAVGAAALLVAGLGASLLYVIEKLSQVYEIAGAQMIAYLAIAGGLFAAAVISAKRPDMAIILLALTLAAINWVFVLRSLPDFEKYRPVRALSEVIAGQAGPDARVGYYRTASPSMVFYLRRPIFEYYRPEELSELMASGEDVYCLMTAEDYEAVKGVLGVPTIVLASRPTFHVKLRSILDRTKTPQMLLISNKLGARTSE